MRLLLAVVAALLLAPAAAAQEPEISAPAAIVLEPSTGDVVYEKAPDERRQMASTTKLMTALLTLEQADLDAVVSVPRYDALPVESAVRFTPGEKVTVADLLRALLVYSANDAAVALADHVAGSVPSFVRMMNRRAQQLGLSNTSYANPVGLDEVGNYSTPRDLASLTLELRKDDFFRKTVRSRSVTLTSGARPRTLETSNDLMEETLWVDGVKTGNTTQAGDVLVASGRKRRGEAMISVVMGAVDETTRDEESLALLEYGMERYKVATLVEQGERSEEAIAIEDRAGATLPVAYGRTIRRVIRKGEDVHFRVDVPAEVAGPIKAGSRVGEALVFLRGEQVARIPMVAAIDVPAAGFGRRLQNLLTEPWMLLVLGGVLLAATAATQRRASARRPTSRRPPAEEPT